jgi:ribose 5-phosphate isomerase A
MSKTMESLQAADALAETALQMIEEGYVVGLGSGRTATAFVNALGRKVREGLHVHCVPTSHATANLALELGISLVDLDEIDAIDITVDGADEVDQNLNLIKGLGGALVREIIVAASSRRLVIVVQSRKIVSQLGEHGVLPLEVVPFAESFCRRRLIELGYPSTPRQVNGLPYVTDNSNHILDCRVPIISNPAELDQMLRAIPGVVGTGLFIGMAHTILIQDGNEIKVWQRQQS